MMKTKCPIGWHKNVNKLARYMPMTCKRKRVIIISSQNGTGDKTLFLRLRKVYGNSVFLHNQKGGIQHDKSDQKRETIPGKWVLDIGQHRFSVTDLFVANHG